MPFAGYGRKTNKTLDLSWLPAAIGAGGKPELNPEAGVSEFPTEPGQVNWQFKGDPMDVVNNPSKYDPSQLYVTPSAMMRLMNPGLANQINSANMQYQMVGPMAQAEYQAKTGQARDIITKGLAGATPEWDTFSPDEQNRRIDAALGATGLSAIQGGLSPNRIGEFQRGREELKFDLPAAQAQLEKESTANQEEYQRTYGERGGPSTQAISDIASGTYSGLKAGAGIRNLSTMERAEKATMGNVATKAEEEAALGIPTREAQLRSEQLKNEAGKATGASRVEVELAYQQARAALDREPDQEDLTRQILFNEKNRQSNIVPQQQQHEAAMAGQDVKNIPFDVSASRNQAVGREIMSRQAPTAGSPILTDVNPKYEPGQPVGKAYKVVPGLNPVYTGLYGKVLAMQNMGEKLSGGGQQMIPMADGTVFNPNNPFGTTNAAPSRPAAEKTKDVPTQPTKGGGRPWWGLNWLSSSSPQSNNVVPQEEQRGAPYQYPPGMEAQVGGGAPAQSTRVSSYADQVNQKRQFLSTMSYDQVKALAERLLPKQDIPDYRTISRQDLENIIVRRFSIDALRQ